MNLDLKGLLIVFTIIQLFVFAVILMLLKRKASANPFFLSVFFITLACNVFNLFMIQNPIYFKGFWIHLFYLGYPFAFAYAPSFYLYYKNFTDPNNHGFAKAIIHYIPFFIYLLHVLFRFTILPTSDKEEFLQSDFLFTTGQYRLLVGVLHLQVFSYILAAVWQLRRYRLRLKNLLSSVEKYNHSWINSLLAGVICLWIMDLSRYFSSYISAEIRTIIETGLFAVFLLFCYFFVYKAFTSSTYHLHTASAENKKVSLSAKVRHNYYDSLQRYMAEKKVYLNPDLTLNDLSELTTIPNRSLSETIKLSTGKNFYDFINSYRIRESKKIFTEDVKGDKTVLEVLYAVGFNSKSAFNSAFRKQTGMTPTEFRNNLSVAKENLKKSS